MEVDIDFVYKKLIEQGGPAAHQTPQGQVVCQYRADDDRKCAAGWLIPDNLYHRNMEGCDATAFAVCEALKSIGYNDRDLELIRLMQCAHDTAARNYFMDPTTNWEHHLKNAWTFSDLGYA